MQSSNDILRKPLLWGLDPLFSTHVKIVAAMLQHMVPGEGPCGPALYFFTFAPDAPPRPIRLISAAGIIVFIQQYHKLTRLQIDDGTGVMRCMIWEESRDEVLGWGVQLRLGQFVQLRGKLEWKDQVPSITALRIAVARDPNAELLWWLSLQRAHSEVYEKAVSPLLPADAEAAMKQETASADNGKSK